MVVLALAIQPDEVIVGIILATGALGEIVSAKALHITGRIGKSDHFPVDARCFTRIVQLFLVDLRELQSKLEAWNLSQKPVDPQATLSSRSKNRSKKSGGHHEEQSRRLRDSCAFTLRSHASRASFLGWFLYVFATF